MLIEKFNTRVKCYPDGNFIATTASRQTFLSKAGRIQKKLEREALIEHLHDLIDNPDLHPAKRLELSLTLQSMEPGACDVDEDEEENVNPIVESLLASARRLGIPINGVLDPVAQKKPNKGNVRRAKDMIFDLIYLNEFDWFATFTFNPKKVDSFDPQLVMKRFKKWLNNHQERNSLRYVAIPEYHPTSGRIHIHMLYSGDLKLVQAINQKDGKKMFTKTGKPIYNCTSWRYGFSTVIPCDGNKAKLAFYVSKYVTKDVQKIFGKFYYSSQGLKRDCPIEYGNRDYAAIKAPPVHVDAINIDYKYESSIKFNSETEANTVAILKELGVTDCEAVQYATV
ncbi:MAG: hypothetical protein ACI4C7_08175 [Clostridia bacterium]